jgi:hypothetical protein
MSLKSIEIDEFIKPFTEKLLAEVVVPGTIFKFTLL